MEPQVTVPSRRPPHVQIRVLAAANTYRHGVDVPQRPWRPLSRRDDPSYEDTLYEGIPEHLEPSIRDWTMGTLGVVGSTNTLRLIERRLRPPVTFPKVDRLLAFMHSEEEFSLDVVDLLCGLVMTRAEAMPSHEQTFVVERIVKLHGILDEAGSAWRVEWSNEPVGLIRRVDATVEQRAKDEIDAGGLPGRHLAASWRHLYGRHPDPDQALDEANKALEAAAKPIVSPKNAKTRLGTIISNLRDKPEKWTTSLGTVPMLIDRLEAIWTVQQRHATDAPPVEPDVIEAAVHDAITLVHWFRADLVRPAS